MATINFMLKLKKEYEKGENAYVLARKYKMNPETVYFYLHKVGTKMRKTKLKKGYNSWSELNEKEVKERKRKLSERMSKYNPMINADVRKKRAESEKKRRGETGRLTHSEKKRIIKKRKKCEICNLKYPLTVHHKDRNRYNNKDENLQVLCFNCHYDVEFGYSKYGQRKWNK